MSIGDCKKIIAFTSEFFKEIEASYRRFLGTELRMLIDAQLGICPHKLPGYRVGNEVFYFTPDGQPLVATLKYLPFNMMPGTLHNSLLEQHKRWTEHYAQHDRDFPRIKQILGSLIIRAKDLQQLRDMFPDHVIRPMLKSELLARHRERMHPDLYAGQKTDPGYPAERQRREIYWEPKLLDMYESVGLLVDQYLGYKFLT